MRSSLGDLLADRWRCYARGNDVVNQRSARSEKEKICLVIFVRQASNFFATRNVARIPDALQQN
jgi:hypothetical protein